jgi:phosphate:Na+ symporter
MADFAQIKEKIRVMAELVFKMWQESFRTFMKHDEDLIPPILEIENKVNSLEKEITAGLVEIGKSTSDNSVRFNAGIYADVAADLELIGDYCKDFLERVQIKIEENLLFSEESVKEFESLYRKSEEALDEVVRAFQRDDYDLAREVLRQEGHIEGLVDEYRRRHNERLMKGICQPIACNLFVNMLEFTADIYYHTNKISKNLLKIRSVA